MKVQVRDTSAGRVLRVGGSQASLYRPGRSTTGSIWDLLAAPLLLAPERRRRRVLLLGVGGGSVARLLRSLDPEADLLGVEMSREVVEAARRHFDLDATGLAVRIADARRWLARQRRPRFDLIVDDVFIGSTRTLQKPEGWGESLRRAWELLRPGGILAMNGVSTAQERLTAWPDAGRRLRLLFKGYENRVVVARRGGEPLHSRQARERMAAAKPLRSILRRTAFRAL